MHEKIKKVIESTRMRVAAAKGKRLPELGLEQRDFGKSISRKPFALITEIKPASPSRGKIANVAGPSVVSNISLQMQRGGADALSVLTEPTLFGGSLENIAIAKRTTALPVLRKDFTLDLFQLDEAKAYGCDAILLDVEFLGEKLPIFLEHARSLKLDCLVECRSENGILSAVSAGAEIIGINNRSFEDLSVDLARTERLAPLVPEGKLLVCESGIFSKNDIDLLLPFGVGAFLVGTSIMQSSNIEQKIKELKAK